MNHRAEGSKNEIEMTNAQVSKLSYSYHLLSLGAAYVTGLIGGNLILVPFITGLGAFVFAFGGMIAALPLLAIASIMLVWLKGSIESNILLWCILAVFSVPLAWMVMEYLSSYSGRLGVLEYISLRNVWERVCIAFVCSCTSALVYYLLIKAGLRKAGTYKK